MAGEEIDEGEASQQSRACHPATGIANSSSANDGVQADLSASRLESTPRDVAAGGDKKTHLARAKGKNPGAFARVWSVEDDVRILECLAGYVKVHGEPPARAQLREVVVGQVVDQKKFTVTQIYEKVRRLRNQYYTMRSTTTAAAGAPLPGDAEELRKYQLSRQIWGDSLLTPKRETGENGSGQAPKARLRREFEELQRMYPYLAVLVEEIAAGDRRCLKRAFGFIDDSKARKLDAKVKKQRVLEMQIQQDRRSAQTEVLRTLLQDKA